MPIAIDLGTISEGAERLAAINCTDELDSGELLDGTPSVDEVNPDANAPLTISDKAKSTTQLLIKKVPVAAGAAIQFFVKGAKAGVDYTLLVTCRTTSTPKQLLVYDVTLRGE